MELLEMITRLSRANGPTGAEESVTELAGALLEPLVDQVKRDAAGNMFGIRRAAVPNPERILLDAHLDEVSLVVTGHENGMCKVASTFGGIDPRLLPASRMLALGRQPVYGVMTCLPPHILTEEERNTPFSIQKLRLDCGLSQEEAKALLPVGTMIVSAAEPAVLGQQRICGKALDDRAGFAVVLRVLQLLQNQPLPVDVWAVGSVQEEGTLLGAAAAGLGAAPREAIVVDATFGDSPDSDSEDTFRLGHGPVIGIGPVLNRRLSQKLCQTAERRGIPVQKEILGGSTGTNSMAYQIAGEGVACGLVSFPLRYMHTPGEVADLRDLESAAQLIASWLLEQGEETAHG